MISVLLYVISKYSYNIILHYLFFILMQLIIKKYFIEETLYIKNQKHSKK